MRHLVVCCDGTWNTPEQTRDGVPVPTNVVKLHHALEDRDDQLRYYHPGVGTEPGLVDRLRGGGLGTGLEANIKSAYNWLAATYQDGDTICLFGFSRGAYTVRSLAGMLDACGLASFPPQTPSSRRWREIDRLYDEVYRPLRRRTTSVRPYPPVPIRFLGVWDTVGALGIPDSLGLLKLLDVPDRCRFHDTRLGPGVQHARHAVALDETRGPFTPTLWRPLPDDAAPGRTMRQVWFPGNHGDVGGGHPQTGLSDAALLWMIEEAREFAGLRFRADMVRQLRPDPTDVLHDDCRGFYQHLAPTPRAVPLVDEKHSGDVVHKSAFVRQSTPPITVGAYRAGRLLGVGQDVSLDVFAAQRWNSVGLYLEPGRYRFRAEGEWLDRGQPVGPGGTRDGRFHLSEVFQMAGSFVGWWQERYRHVSGDAAADFFGAPRAPGAPWMSLIGVVAGNDVDENGAQQPYRPFLIAEGCTHTTVEPGYLYTFANDAWGFYDNNKGSVTLTVTRLE
jgi:hypothetical protein